MSKNPDQQENPPHDVLKRAKEVEHKINDFYNLHAGNVNMMLLTPWGAEQAAATMALKAEAAEAEGDVFYERSAAFWQKYETRYGSLNTMIQHGQITLELALDAPTNYELETFVTLLARKCQVSLTLLSHDEIAEDSKATGMTLPVYLRNYILTVN